MKNNGKFTNLMEELALEELNQMQINYFKSYYAEPQTNGFPETTKGSEHKAFLKYLKDARKDFCSVILRNIPVKGNLEVRTEIDSFLIAFDQAYERLEDKL